MKPETTFKVGNARASVFKHRNRNRDSGQEFETYSVHVHRQHEKSPGEWISTSYFRLFELPQVALVLRLATAYVADREAVQEREIDNGSANDAEASAETAPASETAA